MEEAEQEYLLDEEFLVYRNGGRSLQLEFLKSHYISAQSFQRELWKKTIHVAFPKKINLGEIGECEVELPILPEQTKIANFLSTIDDKIHHTKLQIEKAVLWKKGLMQQMFC